jgi:SAM-dependent methyltransferase
MNCNVCACELGEPLYSSNAEVSVTSLCELVKLETRVYFCAKCGHLQTPPLVNLDDYYHDYRLLMDSDDEDQPYNFKGEKQVFRSEHQAETLLSLISLKYGANVLDYGCGKAVTMKQLRVSRPDLKVHLFDVSDTYVPFWKQHYSEDVWAIQRTKEHWKGQFDLVTSFFSLEHMPNPQKSVAMIFDLLTPNGIFYAIVPDWTKNKADFVVVDHVNHFSIQSLSYLFESAGLIIDKIELEQHDCALIIAARKPAGPAIMHPPNAPAISHLFSRAQDTANYWTSFRDRVQSFEKKILMLGLEPAIYGAGFYGTYIAACLENFDAIRCFLDRNFYLHQKKLLDKEIKSPADLPPSVNVLYVGLNPDRAPVDIEKVLSFRTRQLKYFFP